MRKCSFRALLGAALMCIGAVFTQAPLALAAPDATTAQPAASVLPPYTFTHYFNYEWWTIHRWGGDEVSKYYQKKYNITVNFSKPDSDPAAELDRMIASGNLPDSIMMDRGPDNLRLARLGKLLPLEPFMARNKNLQNNVLPPTIKQLQIDGKLYNIPNWPRKSATGGNDAWMYDKRIWEAVGKPALRTLNDLYNYATKAKKLGKNKEGLSIIPVMFDNTYDGYNLGRAFYRSYGGVQSGWYSYNGGRYQLALRDPVFKQATMELNKWWREGLVSASQFTDSYDQIRQKLVSGRNALLFFDHSQDSVNSFRKTLMMKFPGDSYELTNPLFPPAAGVSKVYADYKETIGWNVTCITTKAKQPERIFTLWTDFLTWEGSIIMMYGPKGFNWDQLNAAGLPLLKKSESEQTTEEKNALGCWYWAMPGQLDNVDKIKFGVNDLLPVAERDWVTTQQAHKFTPIMWVSDEFVGIADIIDPQSREGINRRLCEDYIIAQYPKVIRARTAAEASKIYDGILSYCNAHGLPTVETLYNKKYRDNVAKYGTGQIAKFAPAAPTNVKAASASYSSIKLTWGAVSEASGYEVFRATSSSGSYSKVATLTSGSTVAYTNTGITTGKTYYYKVRAYQLVGSAKAYSGYSAVVSTRPVPAAPANIKAASAGYNSIKMTWAAVSGASGYEIYRATSSSGTYGKVAAITGGSAVAYINTGLATGTTCYYKVKAYRQMGSAKVYSGYSAVVSARPVPMAPTGVKAARASATSIKVSWNAVAGATGYEVYRATASGGAYSLVKTTAWLDWTNTGLTTGRTYYYKVRAYRTVNGAKVYGAYSAVVFAKP